MNTQKLTAYQVDAFSNKLFSGNPAVVVPLDDWLPDNMLQALAMEHNQSETAFFVRNKADYDLRWFTPTKEVPLCGHATLASAHVLFEHLGHTKDTVTFHSKSGALIIERKEKKYSMDFPVNTFHAIEISPNLMDAFGDSIMEAYQGGVFIMLVFNSEKDVRDFEPAMAKIALVNIPAIIITAKGDSVDFVSRLFAPNSGIPEDPVTGSAHCMLTPYWSTILDKEILEAEQVSSRGGKLTCTIKEDRVLLIGSAKTYSKSEIYLG